MFFSWTQTPFNPHEHQSNVLSIHYNVYVELDDYDDFCMFECVSMCSLEPFKMNEECGKGTNKAQIAQNHLVRCV